MGHERGEVRKLVDEVGEGTADLAQFECDLELFERASRTNPGSVDIARLLGRWVDGYSAGTPG